ncbi:MAG: arginase [Bacteroidia bacterium]|nr:arginase [Bacteroidia bacterium]
MADISILINKSEIGAGTRGSSLGPEAIITAASNKDDSIFNGRTYEFIPDRNSTIFRSKRFKHAIRIDEVHEQLRITSFSITNQLNDGKFPILLSGDHSLAAGTLAGIKNAFPKKRIGAIWIDAHADLHSPFTSPSGNIHGMPLSIALQEDNTEIASNRPNQEAIEYWEKLKFLSIEPPVLPEDLVILGLRSFEKAEQNLIRRKRIKHISVKECRDSGIGDTVTETLTYLKDCDLIYISFDVDCMDPDLVSYGTGTPVEDGFEVEECREMLEGLCKDPRVVALEFVEVNPCLDNKMNKMAETAYELLEASIHILENHHK